jgi:hypothetical protein
MVSTVSAGCLNDELASATATDMVQPGTVMTVEERG